MQTENNLPPSDYDEIDLRDIFRTLGKGKKVIAGVTILCMLLSGIYSFLIAKPVYEARALIAPASVNQLDQSSNLAYIIKDDTNRFRDGRSMSDSMDQIVKLAQVDINHYKVILTSDYILQRTIESLKLPTTPEILKAQVKVEASKGVSNDEGAPSEVAVQNTNPKEAAEIANCLVNETALYLNQMNKQKMTKLLNNLEGQQEIEKKGLDEAFAKLNKYRSETGNADSIEASRLQNEVNRREDVVNAMSSKILELKVLQSFDSAEDKVVVLSAATAPESPVKPNKTLNVAIAGVLGLMISVFGIFLAEYIKKED